MNRSWWLGAVAVVATLGGCAPAPVLDNPDLAALGTLADEVSLPRAMGDVNGLMSSHEIDAKWDCTPYQERLNPLGPFCYLSHDQAQALIRQGLQDTGLTYREQVVDADPVFPIHNLIAELPGTTRPQEVVIVGAHYDAFWGGADDNGTGVAAVMELARVFAGHHFDRTVRFVAFDFEETGAMGSEQFVAARDRGEEITTALVFDCIGYTDSTPGSQGTLPGLPAPDRGDFLAVIANDRSSAHASEAYALNGALGIGKVIPLIAPDGGWSPEGEPLLRSDHTSFWLDGQNAVFFTDTAPFRNPNYHSDTDVLDTLDPAFFHASVRLAAVSLAYWAGGPR
jgi:peptidase M28-like protein